MIDFDKDPDYEEFVKRKKEAEQRLKPKDLYAQCDECPYKDHDHCPSYFPEDYGWELELDPTILFVAQAPGDTELLTKQPLTGPSGKQHYSLMRSAGMNKPQYPHANVVNCHPGKNPQGGDKKPSHDAMLKCFERLKHEIQTIRPKLIISLGEEAMFALTRQTGMQSKRGSVFPLIDSYEYECMVYCCLHPSFVRRQRQWIPLAIQNYKEALHYAETGEIKRYEPKLILDPDAETLQEYLNSDKIIYGVDTESTGLSYFDDSIIGHSFSKDRESAVAVAYASEEDPRIPVVRDFLSRGDRKKCWQNGSYDTGILEGQWGIKSEGFEFDTRLAQQLLNSDLPSNLDFLRSQYTDIPPYKPSKKEYKRLASIGKDRVLHLAAMDAVTTRIVMEKQLKQLHPSQLRLMNTLLIPLVEILNEVELRGVLVDQERLVTMYAQLSPLVEERAKPFEALGLNPRSPKQLAAYMEVPTTSEKYLNDQIKRQHPHAVMMQQILDYREVQVLQSKYIVGIYKRLRNGRIHTHYKIEGTGTGRLASVDPNLQNVPDVFRSIYIPDVGYIFVSGDWKQIELWVLAIVAEEWQMLDDLKNGLDVHFLAAKLCFPHIEIVHNDRKKDFTHWQELAAKTVVFGTAYGRGKRSIAREFGVSEYEAARWQSALLGRWPGLGNYQRRCIDDFERRGYVKTPFGRIRYLDRATQGLNTPIQSTAADVFLTSFVMLRRECDIFIPLTVYDDITAMLPIETWEKDFATMKEVMTRPIPELGNESFRVDFKKGMNWYDMEHLE